MSDVTARDRVHIKACMAAECGIETGTPEEWCKRLDRLLDQVEREALQRAYQKLLGLHMGTLLQHGPGVAQGIALGVRELHGMILDRPVSESVSEGTERTPGEQPHDECLSPDAAGKCPHGITETAE
jgi:hypothetical protein